MPAFATESDLRTKFQIDANAADTDLVQRSIDDAHAIILARLDPSVDTQNPPDNLVQGEVLLAGAGLLGALASKEAHTQQDITVGGQRIRRDERFEALIALVTETETQAWRSLAPYLKPETTQKPATVTDTVPVLGEE